MTSHYQPWKIVEGTTSEGEKWSGLEHECGFIAISNYSQLHERVCGTISDEELRNWVGEWYGA